MGSALLERDDALGQLHVALAAARDGRGGLALVAGEAGAGKTSVVRELLAHAAGRPRLLLGACDPLSAPRPFGPLIDAIQAAEPDLAHRLVTGASRAETLAAARALVDGRVGTTARATIFVIEDAHWADDATLDLITFLGRRITTMPTLLVVTYRDDEVTALHPLRSRLGELAPAICCRIWLPPLSEPAIAQLTAGTAVDPAELRRLTGGNPFFVTEVLGAGGSTLPESVRDAVLARAGRLPPHARAVLDAAAVVPGRVERWLLDEICSGVATADGDATHPGVASGLDICVERDVLRIGDGGAVAFRHELARLAIADAAAPNHRRQLHRLVLAALRRETGDAVAAEAARIAFHAHQAGDAHAVLEHAPAAAAAAARQGAHREAVRHLEAALTYRHLLHERRRAELLMLLGAERCNLSQWGEALDPISQAADLYASIGDVDAQAEALVMSRRPLWGLGRQPEATAHIEQAAAVLADKAEPSRGRAAVAMALSAAHMLARQPAQAEETGRQAIALAEASGSDDVLAEACIQSGISLCMAGDDGGLDRIRRGIHLAGRAGWDNLVTLGHMQIGSGYGELRRYDVAVPALREGIGFSEERELVGSSHYMAAWLGRCELELGHWDEAGSLVGALAGNPRCLGNSRLVVLVTLGWLRARRHDPDIAPVLDEALELARAASHIQRLWPVAACRAEAAWLDDRLPDELGVLDEVMAMARSLDYWPAIEELSHWRAIADGVPQGDPASARTPFGLSAGGRHDLAAQRWAEIGCPYEEAMARSMIGTASELRAALTVFEQLGAAPMRTRVAAALRGIGEPVPRRPVESTRRNPHSLTDRELDVLGLVGTGRTNREIAGVLGISSKTVDHHVSHILTKLGVRSRAEAAVEADRLGLVAPRES
jgi:DNA-binding CsgD family transcriptional regulator/tetratricopeptide (TPR) repeat protein